MPAAVGGASRSARLPAKRGVARPAAPRLAFGARNAEDGEVILGGRDTGDGEPLDQGADAVELTLSLGFLAEQDVRAFLLLDRRRRHWQLHHVERQAKGFDVLAMATEIVEAPMMRVARGIDTDMGDPELGPDAIVGIIPGSDLRSEMHHRSSAPAVKQHSRARGLALPSARATIRGRTMDGAAFSDLGSPSRAP